MKHWLLDTSALLALRDDEAGADRVAALLGSEDEWPPERGYERDSRGDDHGGGKA